MNHNSAISMLLFNFFKCVRFSFNRFHWSINFLYGLWNTSHQTLEFLPLILRSWNYFFQISFDSISSLKQFVLLSLNFFDKLSRIFDDSGSFIKLLFKKNALKRFVLSLDDIKLACKISDIVFMFWKFDHESLLLFLVSLNTIQFECQHILVDDLITYSNEFSFESWIIRIHLSNLLEHLIKLLFHSFCIEIWIFSVKSTLYNTVVQF